MQTAVQETASATPNSSGVVTFTFNPVHRGRVWTGSVVIASSTGQPISTITIAPIVWEAKDSGNSIGKWYNDFPSNSMQAIQQVIVTGSNVANTESLQARFTGIETDLDATPIVWPTPPPAPPSSQAKVIVSNAVPIPAGNPTQIGPIQPVLVGTSVELFEVVCSPFNLGLGSSVHLIIDWSVDGSFVDPIEWTIDLDKNAILRGLILPNLAPFIRFSAQSGGAEQVALTALTGLAPIVRPPIVPNGILAFANPPPAGASDTLIPPYIGPALLYMAPNNLAGYGVEIDSFDWTGAQKSTTRNEQGWPAGTGPFASNGLVYLPPLINHFHVTGSPGPGATATLVPLGP